MSAERIGSASDFAEYDKLQLNQLGEVLEGTRKRLSRLRRKTRKINREYVPRVKNPLVGFTAMYGEEALIDMIQNEADWENALGYRDLYFEDLSFKDKLQGLNNRIKLETLRFSHVLGLIKQR